MITSPKEKNEDKVLDQTLRPLKWDDYIGQDKIKSNLKILIEAAKKRKEPPDHILLYGPAGLGKTTLAYIIAEEMSSNIRVTSGPAIERVGDLASLLTNLAEGDVLFIDEAHRLNKMVEEILYPALESRVLNIILGKGPSARTIQLDLVPFTLIAATTRIGLMSSPLRSRFGATHRLDFYLPEEIENIINRSSKILNIPLEKPALNIIARSSRFTPRVANRLLKRVRDYTQVKGEADFVSEKLANEALSLLEIDRLGLEPTDRRILEIIIDKFEGGPVGLQSIAAAAGEEIETIEEVNEPYLLQIGFLARTPRGRIVTKSAYEHLGLKFKKHNQAELL